LSLKTGRVKKALDIDYYLEQHRQRIVGIATPKAAKAAASDFPALSSHDSIISFTSSTDAAPPDGSPPQRGMAADLSSTSAQQQQSHPHQHPHAHQHPHQHQQQQKMMNI